MKTAKQKLRAKVAPRPIETRGICGGCGRLRKLVAARALCGDCYLTDDSPVPRSRIPAVIRMAAKWLAAAMLTLFAAGAFVAFVQAVGGIWQAHALVQLGAVLAFFLCLGILVFEGRHRK